MSSKDSEEFAHAVGGAFGDVMDAARGGDVVGVDEVDGRAGRT